VSFLALLAIGLLLNAAASLFVFWRGSLDADGAIVGAVLGTLIFACGGPLFWVILMAFFISSTALGRVGSNAKAGLKTIHEKGGRRDLFQVLANGGVGMLAAILFRITDNPAWAAGFAVSFASSNADTWASELGVLSRAEPVSLLTFRPVRRGVSGGVSLLGLASSLGGGLFIALIFASVNLALGLFSRDFLRCALFVAAAGLLGSLLDSLLGATLQAQYVAAGSAGSAGPAAASGGTVLLTERSRSEEGVPNRLARGLRFIDNDVVNFASCALVTAAAVLLSPVLL
jgi:uncharacterized protein (TIGR00297 family)